MMAGHFEKGVWIEDPPEYLTGPDLIKNPQTVEDIEENAKRLWKYYRQDKEV
jgi:hypothetical protein